MGHVFKCDDEIVWDPTNRVGEAYVGMLRALADVFKTPTGITSRAPDWHMIDRDEFGRMVHTLLAARGETSHLYLCRMMDGVLPICIAIYECVGGIIDPKTDGEREYVTEVRDMCLPMGF
jgi:hypothetical protein